MAKKNNILVFMFGYIAYLQTVEFHLHIYSYSSLIVFTKLSRSFLIVVEVLTSIAVNVVCNILTMRSNVKELNLVCSRNMSVHS